MKTRWQSSMPWNPARPTISPSRRLQSQDATRGLYSSCFFHERQARGPHSPHIGGPHLRVGGALLLEQNDAWQLQRRYMQLEALQTASDNGLHRISAVAK